MGVFKSSVKNAASLGENTEKLAGFLVAISEQLGGGANVCGGCNWVAILGWFVGGCLDGIGFQGFGVVWGVVFGCLGSDSMKINRLMIGLACTDSGRSVGAVNPSVF